jgi:hypothetical protein
MDFEIDFLFKTGAGYDELVALIQGNPRYVQGIGFGERQGTLYPTACLGHGCG